MSERPPVDSPAQSDGFVRGVAEVIGGPLGSHASGPAVRPGRFWTVSRIVLALVCLTLVLHWVQKSPCMDGNWGDHIQYKRYCYSDVLALYYHEHLDQGQIPYVDSPVEYPVLTGGLMAVIGLPVHAYAARHPGTNAGEWFYQGNALVLSVLAVAVCGMLLAMRRRRPWDIAIFALAPAIFISATVNWDFLSVAFAVGGLYAWARRRPLLAGALLGLGTAAKLWPGFLLIAIVLLGLRSRKIGQVLETAGMALVVWMVVNVPVLWLNAHNWSEFLRLNRTRIVDWGTLWYIGDHFPRGGDQYGIPFFQQLAANIPLLNNVTYVLIAAGWAAIAVLVFLAPIRPRLGQVAFLVVAVFLIFNKVWSQQFLLWLLPLVVLARPRWWAFLAWQAAELCYFAAFYGQLLGNDLKKPIFPEWVFVLASSLRLGTVALLCALVVRDILRPELDVVRRTHGGDPDAGVLDDAPAPVAPAPRPSGVPVPV